MIMQIDTDATGHRSHRYIVTSLIIICGVLFFLPVRAEEITNHVTVDYIGENIFNGEVITSSTEFIDANGSSYSNTSTVTALGALMQTSRQGNFPVTVQNYGYGYYVSDVAGHSPVGFDGWIYNVNNQDPGYQGINDYQIKNNDSLQIFYSVWPWKIVSDIPTTTVSGTIIFTAYNYVSSTWQISPSTTISINNEKYLTDNSGQYTYIPTTTGTISAFIFGTDAWPQNSPNISVEVLDVPTPITITEPPPTGDTSGGSNNNSTSTPQTPISQSQISNTVNKILNYFKSQQSADGKIIDGTITDWAIMSFGANNQYADEIKNATTTLLDYEKKYNLDDPSDMNSCATYPRHILALLSAGVDKNDSAIAGLKNKMQTICYKDNLYGLYGINDDVFALLALLAIDENVNAPIIQAIVSTTESWQLTSGAFSWPDWYDPTQKTAGDDITGATVNALKYAQTKGAEIDNEIFTKAKNYLKTTQQADGGWGYGSSDIMTTSWVLMGVNALNETQDDWFTASGTNPWYPLVNQLKTDGYYESAWVPGTIDWFAMKHAVPALLGKSWPIILPAKVENFSEGATFTYGGGGPNTPPPDYPTTSTTPTTTTATTTVEIPTTTIFTTITSSTTTSTIITTTTTQTPNTNPPTDEAGSPTPTTISEKPLNHLTIKPLNNNQLPTNNEQITINKIGKTLSPVTTTIPYTQTARGVFATATTLAGGLGIFLVWRLLQTLV